MATKKAKNNRVNISQTQELKLLRRIVEITNSEMDLTGVLKEVVEAGDHLLFIGEPVYAAADEDLFEGTWEVDKVKLIYHLGGGVFTTSASELTI